MGGGGSGKNSFITFIGMNKMGGHRTTHIKRGVGERKQGGVVKYDEWSKEMREKGKKSSKGDGFIILLLQCFSKG